MFIVRYPPNSIPLSQDLSTSTINRAQQLGKKIFTAEKAELQKKSVEYSSSTLKWKMQTVSASVDLMVWTVSDEQGKYGV